MPDLDLNSAEWWSILCAAIVTAILWRIIGMPSGALGWAICLAIPVLATVGVFKIAEGIVEDVPSSLMGHDAIDIALFSPWVGMLAVLLMIPLAYIFPL